MATSQYIQQTLTVSLPWMSWGPLSRAPGHCAFLWAAVEHCSLPATGRWYDLETPEQADKHKTLTIF